MAALPVSISLAVVILLCSLCPTSISELIGGGAEIITQRDLEYYCGLTSEVPNPHTIFEKSNVSLEVQTGFTLDHFIELDDVEESFTVSGIFVLKWVAICWSPEFYKIVQRAAGPGNPSSKMFARKWQYLFHPRIRFRNSISDSGMEDGFDTYLEAVCSTGSSPNQTVLNFVWTRYGRFEARCSLQLFQFPFDSQECSIDFATHTPWINITAATIVRGFMGGHVVSENAAWQITGSSSTVVLSTPTHPTTQAIYSFNLKRRPSYYVYNILIPCLVLCLLQLLVFILPGKAVERANYSVTVLLALVFMLSLVQAAIPKVSQRIYLTEYILIEAGLCAICTLETNLICHFVRSFPAIANTKVFDVCSYKGKQHFMSLHRFIDMITLILIATALLGLNMHAVTLSNG